MNLSLRARLTAGSSIPVAMILIITALVFSSVHALLNANHWVIHTYKAIDSGRTILGSMVDMETGMRGFLVAGKDEFLEPYHTGQKVFSERTAQLKQTVSDNPAQVERLNKIIKMEEAWTNEVAQVQIAIRRQIAKSHAVVDKFNTLSKERLGKRNLTHFVQPLPRLTQS